jgi:hypothetical protein
MQAGFQDAVALFDEIAAGPGFFAEPVFAVLFPACEHDVGEALEFQAHSGKSIVVLEPGCAIAGLAGNGHHAVVPHPALGLESRLQIA